MKKKSRKAKVIRGGIERFYERHKAGDKAKEVMADSYEKTEVKAIEVKAEEVKSFGFKDLPLSLRMVVERETKLRERLKKPLEIKEREERMVRWFRGDKER